MPPTNRSVVLTDVLSLMAGLADDWDYTGPLTSETYLFGDLGFESLDLVVLATTIQERYGRLPFSEFLAEIGQRETRDLSIGELVDFVCEHIDSNVSEVAR
jgi:acyl carrier protein